MFAIGIPVIQKIKMKTKLFIGFVLTYLCLSCANVNGKTNPQNNDLISKVQEMNLYYYMFSDTTFLDSMELLLNNANIDYADDRALTYRLFVFAHKNENQEAIDFLNEQIKAGDVDDTGLILRKVYGNIFLMRDAKLHGKDSLVKQYLDDNIAIFKNQIGGNESKMVESLYNLSDGPDGIAYMGDSNKWIFSGYLIMLAMKDKQLATDEAIRLSEKYPMAKDWIEMSMNSISGLNQYTQLTLSLEEINSIIAETNDFEILEEYCEPVMIETEN